jgi:hypothetical protein
MLDLNPEAYLHDVLARIADLSDETHCRSSALALETQRLTAAGSLDNPYALSACSRRSPPPSGIPLPIRFKRNTL